MQSVRRRKSTPQYRRSKDVSRKEQVREIDAIHFPEDGRRRVVISGVKPEIDEGRYPIKRTVGERVVVEADIYSDGHDALSCRLMTRRETDPNWHEVRMAPLGNDRWRGEFKISELENYYYCIAAVVDPFFTWHKDLTKRVEAGQDISSDLLVGADLVAGAAERATGAEAQSLALLSETLRTSGDTATRTEAALGEELLTLMLRHVDRTHETVYPRQLRVRVDRPKARFSTWYELFPRSCTGDEGRHGTFRDCESWLDYVASMGFDVLYLPPIHPIGKSFRKGPNNNPEGGLNVVGSPWAIGAAEGGHTAIHPELGTLTDFHNFVAAAGKRGIEIAMDLAWQCSPDHPYVKAHPVWFRKRPDGTIQYAENPPKKYQDIYPLNFETPEWKTLWMELREVVEYWIEHGIRMFRVDNPHTKPFVFWEWLIGDVQRKHPETLFLSEAFTRPKVLYELAKRGFTQSYTYYTWRNTKWELEQYFTELTQTDAAEYFRPNLWPNTPDILTDYLKAGGRPAFVIRLILAATLGANYGIYGPAYELCEDRPREAGSEEYLDSEKYEIRHWNLDAGHSLKEVIARVNRIRREQPALQNDRTLLFHEVDNDQIIAYSKSGLEGDDVVLMIVSLDPHYVQSGWTRLDLEQLGVEKGAVFQVQDLLSAQSYTWQGERNYVRLDPQVMPAHILHVQCGSRSEKDFEQYQ